MKPLDHARGKEIRVEVLVKTLLDAWAQHLDGDWLQRAARLAHAGLMHLGDRGGCDRRSEFGEQRGDRRFQRVFNRLSRFVLREGREAVLQGGEIGRKLAADDVIAGGEELDRKSVV